VVRGGRVGRREAGAKLLIAYSLQKSMIGTLVVPALVVLLWFWWFFNGCGASPYIRILNTIP
jgi:hypothetical protein